MNVVLDTNVFVAAGFNPRSSSAAILKSIRADAHRFVWNRQTQAETRKILQQIPPLSWGRFADLFAAQGEHTGSVEPERFQQVSDPDDRKFAALALAADAVLISNDNHLLSVREDLAVRVLSPAEFAAQYDL
ncbi:MAG: putative toxin-antitoxin system toxin component, PIN family [Chloroflexota bacterium]